MINNSIVNLSSLMNKLNKLGVNAHKEVKKSMAKNIKLVQGEAKTLCPVDSGDLRQSIYTKTEVGSTSIMGIVYTNMKYAAYQEFGTGQAGASSPSPPKSPENLAYREDWQGIPAQPYMYPALKNNEDKVVKNIKGDLKTAIRKAIRK